MIVMGAPGSGSDTAAHGLFPPEELSQGGRRLLAERRRPGLSANERDHCRPLGRYHVYCSHRKPSARSPLAPAGPPAMRPCR